VGLGMTLFTPAFFLELFEKLFLLFRQRDRDFDLQLNIHVATLVRA